jgi:hypothetical protein
VKKAQLRRSRGGRAIDIASLLTLGAFVIDVAGSLVFA